VKYDFGELDELSLGYAVTILKSQGAEFPAVVIPFATQHDMLLQGKFIYTGITRGKRLLELIGQKKALGIAVRNDRPQRRYSGILASLRCERRLALALGSGSASEPKTEPIPLWQSGDGRTVALMRDYNKCRKGRIWQLRLSRW
jgi:hypothetical protein